jgi:tRNA (guanine37-N1)-methyltransferase
MRAPALLVGRERGESTRRALVAAGALRTDLAIFEEAGRVVFPVVPGVELAPEWGEVSTRDFAARSPDGPTAFRELLGWDAAALAALPRAFDVVGDIVLVRLPEGLEARRFEVGEALLRFVPGARIVGLDRGVQGPDRRRAVERIAGAGGWRTRHRENGVELDVDVEAAYFSPRLGREHARIAAEVRRGERVYDLCCGVGPFAVTMARDGKAASIVAVDANPAAIALLRSTLARYPFGHSVRAVEARLESFVPTAGPVDRVVLNLPHEGIKYAALVAPLLVPGGSLHFYEVVSRDEVAGRGTAVESALSGVGTFAVDPVQVVHPYSPARDLIAVTARRHGS